MKQSKPFPRVLTIAGSDSSGGAGIQADLKTFGALGAYSASVITAVTAQNTLGVQSVHVVPASIIEAQCISVLSDIRIDAVKIGMLPNIETIKVVARCLQKYKIPFVVLDPVLVATSGDALALENTIDVLCDELLPLADVITPNLNELSQLASHALPEDETQMLALGKQLLEKNNVAVLLKGGHWQNNQEARDWLIQKNAPAQCFVNRRVITNNTHGTGCTLSAAITALYPHHRNLNFAVSSAKSYLHGALTGGQYWHIGEGHGPVSHSWRIIRDQ